MNILITGGSGFVGSHVADYLTKKGHKVTIFDLKQSKWKNSKQRFIKGSLFGSELIRAVKNQEIIFNFAAISDIDESIKKPEETALINIVGLIRLLKLAKKNKIQRFIQASSIYVNSNTGSFYRCSKKAGEEFIEEFSELNNLNYTIIRYGSIYGNRAPLTNGVTSLIELALKNKKITYHGSKKAVRRYIHIEDVCKGSSEILKRKYINKHILLTGYKETKVKDLMQLISKKTNIKKIQFLNKKNTGHYVKNPFSYKPKKASFLKLKNNVNFEKSIIDMINKYSKKYE